MKNLPDKMKAVKAHGPEDYRIEEVDRPKAGPGEVILKVGGCGICGSDVHAYYGAPKYWDGDPWMKTPVTPGHEFFGIVVELGEGSEELHDIKIGDRVTTDQILPCGHCKFCRSGRYWMCEVHNMYGFQKDVAEGAMADYIKLYPQSTIYKIPDGVSDAEAAMIEPLACAVHTTERANIKFGDFVVLAGAGTLGLFITQLVALKTPKKFVVLDTNENRLNLAKKYGADIVMNPAKEDVVSKIKEMTDGYGCDTYIEATGVPAGVTQGLAMIRRLGKFVEMSVFSDKVLADWTDISDNKELDVLGVHLSPYTYPIAIDLLERKKVTIEGMLTAKYKVSEFPQAFAKAQDPESIKVQIVPDVQ